jgi:hypothetical protein
MEHYFAWKPSRKHRCWDTKTSRAPDETHPDWQFPHCPQLRAASGSTSHMG